MDYYLGIDIGTSSAKLTLINKKGKIVSEKSRSYAIIEDRPGFKEIDPETWTAAVKAALNEMLTGDSSPHPKQIKAIGTTGQMHTVIFLDKEGKSIRPALMWNDTRTADMVPAIREKIKKHESISYYTK